MTELEFNRLRQDGWNPPSPDGVPCIQHGEPITAVSPNLVTGYHWSEHVIEDVLTEGSLLDNPGDINTYGGSGSQRTEVYGEGFLYTHRDIAEGLGLWDWMERGFLYEVVGYGIDRINSGLVSGGSLDQVERIFPGDKIHTLRELSREEAEMIPTLYEECIRLGRTF